SPLIMIASRYVASSALATGIDPSLGSLIRFYEFLLMPASVPLLAGIIGAVLYQELTTVHFETSDDTKGFRVWELVAAIGLLVVPIIGIALSMTVTHSYTPRFFLVALVGLDLLIALAAQRAAAARPSIGALLAIILFTSFVVTQVRLWRQLYVKRSRHSEMMRVIEMDAASGLPIFVEDAIQYAELFYYATPSLKARLHVTTDVRAYRVL